MSDRTIPAANDRWREQRLRAGWPSVRVERVIAAPGTGGRHVRAVVHLGTLTPADVCVGVTPAPVAEALIATSAECGDDRMWSRAAYGDGRFLFERVIAPCDDTATEWVVHVRPIDRRAARPVLYPLRVDASDVR